MADRTSAGIFGDIFKELAKDEPIDRVAFAKKVWEWSQGYDFSEYQMDCDDALLKLGLARRGIDPRYPNDGESIIYGEE